MTVPPGPPPWSPAAPRASTPPRYRPASEWAVLAVIAACTVTAFELAQAVSVFSARNEYIRASRDGLDPADVFTVHDVFTLFSLVALLLAYPATCLWLQRVRRNAEALRPLQPHGLGRGWVWGGWVCPVVNFWFPYQVVRDIRRATASTTGADMLLGGWWAAWLVGGVLENVAGYLVPSSGDRVRPAVDWLRAVEVVSAVVWVLALIAWLVIIRQVQRDQSLAAAQQTMPLPAAPTAPAAPAVPAVPADPYASLAAEPPRRSAGVVAAVVLLALAPVAVAGGLVVLVRSGGFASDPSSGEESGGNKEHREARERTGTVNVESLQVGDCLFSDEVQTNGGSTYTVDLVSCGAPHDTEVYAAFELSEGEFPGRKQVERLADLGCRKRFKGFVGLPYRRSVLDVVYLYPMAGSWAIDREVVCMVNTRRPTTGTLKGASR